MNSHFYIYDASAGSGKTFTITRKYLNILLKQDKNFSFQNILAITFTNKAAAEMKQRILQALVCFSGLDDTNSNQDLLKAVMHDTQMPENEIRTKSLQILKLLIPNYASFEVSTIDSFNHRIIRTFAKDLNISQNFEVELDARLYIDKALENMIEQVGVDEELTAWLTEYINYKISNFKSGNIQKDLKDYAELITSEKNYEPIEKIQDIPLHDLKTIKFQLIDLQKKIKEKIKEGANEFFQLIENNHIKPNDFTRSYISKYFNKVLGDDVKDSFEANWHNIQGAQLYNKSVKDFVKQSIDNIRPEIESIFLESKALSFDYHFIDKILKDFVPLAMIKQVQYHLNTIKQEDEILFVNDFNRLISEQIKNQPVPYIYERLGEKFKHYFIDEFQDTSTLQWQNLKPLVENAITTQNSDGSYGSLFLVGDVKQSIYEWRGGDPQQFLNLSQQKEHPFSVKAKKEVLTDNWRSQKEIVDFNNKFFAYASGKLNNPDHQVLFANVHQNEKKKGGYVEINFLPEKKDTQERLDQQVDTLQKIINEHLELGFSLKDICILVRKNKEGIKISQAFNDLENPIPVVSQESLLINADANVQLLIKFLTFLAENDQDNCINFILMWSSLKNLNFQYQELIGIKDKSLKQILHFLNQRGLNFNLSYFRKLSLYDKVEYCIRVLSIEETSNAYVQFFLDLVYEFSNTKAADIEGFLDYWNEKKDSLSITSSEDSDAVKIMTIHKSKGLEFPVVILANVNSFISDIQQVNDWIPLNEAKYGIPYFYSNISKKLSNLNEQAEKVYLKNTSKEELATMNTAYVAMTRPVEHLYILSHPITYKKDNTFEDLLKDYLTEIQIYEEEKSIYTMGSKNKKVMDEMPVIPNMSYFSSYEIKRFYNTLYPNETIENTESKKQIYGKEVHDRLQKIIYNIDINALDKDEQVEGVEEIINHPLLSEFFEKQWTVYNEKELVYDGDILRPDRVCLKGREAVVIDYKTGVEKDKHLEQLTRYKDALEAMDFSIKSAFLVYIRKKIYIKKL